MDNTNSSAVAFTAGFSGNVTMNPALGLVILLQDEEGAPMTTEKALAIVDVDVFKELIGLTMARGWEMRMATPPLWGGDPVERHLTLISPLENAALMAFYTSLYPHNDDDRW